METTPRSSHPTHRIVITGANGQLGHALAMQLPSVGEVKALTRAEADFSNPAALRVSLQSLGESFKPTVVINAAAYTAVDKAQSDTETAWAVNATSVGVLAELAQNWGAMLVHYSTDYVFDGSGHTPWKETDATGPLSVYGQTKLAGEQAIARACPRHLTLRTSWVVGAHGGNFLKTMLRLAAERDSLRVVADQVGVPTSTALLADTTVQLIHTLSQAKAEDGRWGTYHLAAAGETNWCSYGQYVIAGAIARGASLKATPESVVAITSAQYPVPAPRPLNSRLDTRKLQQMLSIALPGWQQGVDAILDQLI